ncbi:unnamed protein product [Rotaria sp. Silwood1]|nr:unnamed protein product [Rotaria sp. Silwood1]
MAATEDTCLDLTTFINTDSSSAIQQNDSLNTASLPSTTAIIMDSDTADDKEINPKTFNRYKSVGNISLSVLSRRLTKRKKLHQRLSVVADIMFILSVLGIILMIIENELTFSQINNHETIARRNSVSQGEIQRCFNLINYFWMIKYDRNYNEQDTAIRYISLSLALIYYFRLSINDVNAHNSNYNIITCEKFGEILSDIISNLVKIVQE